MKSEAHIEAEQRGLGAHGRETNASAHAARDAKYSGECVR